jgi:murein DD-endopeptidase MepM/ murein hydrolase activator NlpD
MRRFLILALLLLPVRLAALEVRFHPADVIYAYEVDPARGLYTVLVQKIGVIQREGGPVTLDSVEIQALWQGEALQMMVVPAAALDKGAQQLSAMEAQGMLKLLDFHFQTGRLLGDGVRLAASRTLSPGTAVMILAKPLVLVGLPEQIAVIARGKDAAGKPVEARGTLRVESHKLANPYDFPLAGTWYVGSGPNFESPHRWAAPEEFGFDLMALGGEGKTHKGDGSKLDDYYGYGRDVLAVGDGVVVDVITDATEANDRLQRPGESYPDFEKRTIEAQYALLAKSYKATFGNCVVIEHPGGEFSQYGHLKQGSVKVKVGDKVARGQAVAQLGHTGNSTEPHLHFQLTDGKDPLYSRGIPIVFRNTVVEGLGYEGRPLQTGWIVTTKK